MNESFLRADVEIPNRLIVLRAVKVRLEAMKAEACGCVHELLLTSDDRDIGDDAIRPKLCVNRRDNPNCTHNDEKMDPLVLREAINPLCEIGVLGNEWQGWNYYWRTIIQNTDDVASRGVQIDGRIPLHVVDMQNVAVKVIEQKRMELLAIVERELAVCDWTENNVLVA